MTPRFYLFLAALALPALLLTGTGRSADDEGTVHLFNGKDLTNFYTYLVEPAKGQERYGKNNDPEKVFTVQDGAIRVSGKVYGAFITEKEYEDYHLVVEFKWGEKTWPPREDKSRDSGVLLHGTGEDGSFGPWMPSIECQMIEGGTGDFLVLSGKDRPYTLTAEAEKRDKGLYYKPGAEPMTLSRGRINWYGRDPQWKDVKGYRGPEDVEKPVGEWNLLECVCAGDTITNVLNGKVVNKGTKVNPHKGKIIFQSEGAEVLFRKIDLKPLKKAG